MDIYRERVEFVGKNHLNNISILLWNITFEDGGEYTCFGRNPKEKGRNGSAIFHLIVVDECEYTECVVFMCGDTNKAVALIYFPFSMKIIEETSECSYCVPVTQQSTSWERK